MAKIITKNSSKMDLGMSIFSFAKLKKLKIILNLIYFCMEHKHLPNFWMVLPNLLSMNILAKSHLALKQKYLYFTASTSAHFGHKADLVMNGCIWEVSPSTYMGFKLCLILPKGPNCLSEPTPEIPGWAVTRLQFSLWREVSPGKEFQVKLEFQLGIAIDGGWVEGWSDLLVIAGTVLQHRVTLTRALERSWASDKHQSNLESFAALWCYQPICRNHLIYGKCHI